MKNPVLIAVMAFAWAPFGAAQAQDPASRVAVMRVDTGRVRMTRPISRVVVEANWAAADTQATTVRTIRRPSWTGERVLARKVVRPGERQSVPLAVRRLPPRAGRAPTAAEDTTIVAQRSADFRVRSDALARIAVVRGGPSRVHPTVAVNLINELDSVGVMRITPPTGAVGTDQDPEDEEYSEYVVSLARSVVRLDDASAVRAVAFGGLGTSREAQRFVARQGTAGLGALDTVFASSEALAPSVVTTWAYALADESKRLDYADSVHLYTRIVMAGQHHPISFAHAVRIAKLYDLAPELDSVAARVADSSPAAAATARVAARAVAAQAAGASTADWLVRLRLRAGLLCLDDSRLGPDRCGRVIGALNEAAGTPGADAASAAAVQGALGRAGQELDAAVNEGQLAAETRGRLADLMTRSGGGPRFRRALLDARVRVRPVLVRPPPG